MNNDILYRSISEEYDLRPSVAKRVVSIIDANIETFIDLAEKGIDNADIEISGAGAIESELRLLENKVANDITPCNDTSFNEGLNSALSEIKYTRKKIEKMIDSIEV